MRGYLAGFEVGPNAIFDWFASRNRLTDERLLDFLVVHPVIRRELTAVRIPSSQPLESRFQLYKPFILDGEIAQMLYAGGAYWTARGDGRVDKAFAVEICDAMFGLRFGEISLYLSRKAWTPWFKDTVSNFTAVIFDRRTRLLWMLLVTDTD